MTVIELEKINLLSCKDPWSARLELYLLTYLSSIQQALGKDQN